MLWSGWLLRRRWSLLPANGIGLVSSARFALLQKSADRDRDRADQTDEYAELQADAVALVDDAPKDPENRNHTADECDEAHVEREFDLEIEYVERSRCDGEQTDHEEDDVAELERLPSACRCVDVQVVRDLVRKLSELSADIWNVYADPVEKQRNDQDDAADRGYQTAC